MTTVLVVDDSAVTCALVTEFLGRAGYQTAEAGNPVEALELVRTQRFDAAVVDIVLPGMDGIQLAQLIRATVGSRSEIPIVFYSAFIDARVTERAHTVEATYLVPKDGDIDRLVHVIDSVVGEKPETS